MIGKISWELNPDTDEMKIIKVDVLGWAKLSKPEDIAEIITFYEVGKTIDVTEYCTNPRYNEIMCTIVSYDPLHHTKNVINV
tara:strand:- start:51 stop:296 length:246 start_codon:yes stop_codon:yes gene_type:complete